MPTAAPSIDQIITELESRIATKTQQINEFTEAIDLLKGDAKYTPADGQLEPFDKMQKMLENATTETERTEKLATAQKALASTRQDRVSLQIELEKLKGEQKFSADRAEFLQALQSYNNAIAQATQAWADMQAANKKSPSLCPGMTVGTFSSVCSRTGVPVLTPMENRFTLKTAIG